MFRIIAPVLCHLGKVVQSRSFNELRLLGELDLVIENLIELEPDEICILSIDGKISEINFQSKAFQHLNIPLTIGGGVDLKSLSKIPAERFLLNSDFFEAGTSLSKAIKRLNGAQSLIGYFPFKVKDDGIHIWNSTVGKLQLCDLELQKKILEYADEYIFLDMEAQGYYSGFDFNIFELFQGLDWSKVLISGGVNETTISTAVAMKLGGVLIDNQALFYNKSVYKRC